MKAGSHWPDYATWAALCALAGIGAALILGWGR
jgi:hypothetical protein